jgi:hypothetical protein
MRQEIAKDKGKREGELSCILRINSWPVGFASILMCDEAVIATMAFILLLAFFFYGERKGLDADVPIWPFRYGPLIEACIVFAFICVSLWMLHREQKYAARDIYDRIETVISQISSNIFRDFSDLRVPFSNSLSLSKVRRDGRWITLPCSYLVEGDVLELMYGDISPGEIQLLTQPGLTLQQNQILRPLPDIHSNDGKFLFRLKSTPVLQVIKTAVEIDRPQTVLLQQMKVLRHFLIRRMFYVFFGLSLVFSITRFILCDRKQDTWFAFLIIHQVYVLLPFIPLVQVTAWIILRAYGNAKVLTLFDQLQKSTTPFDYRGNVDEFDEEAPPPTKDIKLASGALIGRFLTLVAHRSRPNSAQVVNLVEILSSATVICSIDREGTIALVGILYDNQAFTSLF